MNITDNSAPVRFDETRQWPPEVKRNRSSCDCYM